MLSSRAPALLMRRLCRFPVTSIKALQRNCGQVEAFDAARVDVDLIGIGARYIERRHPASRAKVVLRHVSIESVNGEIVPRCEQAEFIARDDPMKIALLRANRAVALSNPTGRTLDLIHDAPAMASAAHHISNISNISKIRHSHKSG